ncbi:MAG: iron ABC transporter permease [candidate division WOR-3 bacterium]|nr:iron ABC transporter permease [candidate division WOR-3 bacterium]
MSEPFANPKFNIQNSLFTKSGWFWLVILLAVAIILSLYLGPTGFSFSSLEIPLRIRLPRIVLGIFAGGVLSLVGASLQGLLQNPLVDPYTLGVASGAAFGASIALIFGSGTNLLVLLFSFLSALFTIVIVYSVARIRGHITKTGLVLAGVIVSFLFSSLTMLVMVFSKKPLAQTIYLLMGHLGTIFTPNTLTLFTVSAVLAVIGSIFLFSYWRSLDILSTSEEAAESLGVDTRKVTQGIFVISSLLVALVVSFTGVISFVGLIIPHIVRLLFGPNHRTLIPGSFLLGASVLLFADILARTAAPIELPLSIVTALFGVPFFIYLLKSKL